MTGGRFGGIESTVLKLATDVRSILLDLVRAQVQIDVQEVGGSFSRLEQTLDYLNKCFCVSNYPRLGPSLKWSCVAQL